ncbi:hypothetical protein MP228_002880 [Amoeboaphelidium protococcarum]|nr:hypothetical protein MP228_002880 [Amoeboaphelidium protococcarum]
MASFNQMIPEQSPQPVRVRQGDQLSILESDVSSLNGMEIQDLDAEYHGSVADHLAQRKLMLQNNISNGRFLVQPYGNDGSDDSQNILINSPFASKLTYDNYHPGIYRSIININDNSVDSIDCLAEYLGVQRVWIQHYETCIHNNMVVDALQTLRDEINVGESVVSMEFYYLVKTIAACMSVKIKLEDQQKVVVGGFMADSRYDYASKCDLRVSDPESGKVLLCTELKRDVSYSAGRPWYEKSRLAQVFAALYASHAPLVLLTPVQFKVFCENSARDRVHTFPFDINAPNVNAAQNLTQPIGRELIKAIVICLCQSIAVSKVQSGSQSGIIEVLKTPLRAAVKLVDSISKRRDGKSGNEKDQAVLGEQSPNLVQPKFFVGMSEDGSRQYQEIRVLSPEQVQELNLLDEDDEESLPEIADWSSVVGFESSSPLQTSTKSKY